MAEAHGVRAALVLVVAAAVMCSGRSQPSGAEAGGTVAVEEVLSAALARVKAADVAKLTQTHPFQAVQYVAAAACCEKLKRTAAQQDQAAAARAAREVSARLDLLAGQSVPAGAPGLLDLLNLGAVPDSQVVVEYPTVVGGQGESECGLVTFYWGAIPLAGATVLRYPSAQEAAKQLASASAFGLFAVPAERTSLSGLPAKLARRLGRRTFDLAGFSAGAQMTLVAKGSGFLRVVGLDLVPGAEAEAVAMLPRCPARAQEAAMAWAKQTGHPVLPLDEAMAREAFLLAGDVRQITGRLGTSDAFTYAVEPEGVDLWVQQGDRIIIVGSASRAICERVARLVLAGKPVRSSQVDALRRELVRLFAPSRPAALLEGLSPYCGDVHMHTLYSDGQPTPVGLSLAACASMMDFAVITDHDTVKGAQVAQRLLAAHGLLFAVIVGEESNADDWSDVAAYPLTTPLPASVPMPELVRAAHAQGAVIQWNHPGGPFSKWAFAHLRDGIGDTGLDAWEHVPGTYEAWKQAGRLPLLVGATDTHDGTFGGASMLTRAVERTLVFARGPRGDDIAAAIRGRQALAVVPSGRLFCGDDAMVALAWAALAEGRALKAATAEQLKGSLREADLPGLLEAGAASDRPPGTGAG